MLVVLGRNKKVIGQGAAEQQGLYFFIGEVG